MFFHPVDDQTGRFYDGVTFFSNVILPSPLSLLRRRKRSSSHLASWTQMTSAHSECARASEFFRFNVLSIVFVFRHKVSPSSLYLSFWSPHLLRYTSLHCQTVCQQERRSRRVPSPESKGEGSVDGQNDRLVVFYLDHTVVQQVIVEGGQR